MNFYRDKSNLKKYKKIDPMTTFVWYFKRRMLKSFSKNKKD
jgi:hypothetical protein